MKVPHVPHNLEQMSDTQLNAFSKELQDFMQPYVIAQNYARQIIHLRRWQKKKPTKNASRHFIDGCTKVAAEHLDATREKFLKAFAAKEG